MNFKNNAVLFLTTLFLFLLFQCETTVHAWPIPDTGQTKCYDDYNKVIPCPSQGQDFFGQDACYSINPMSYTKLDVSGNDLPDSAASWTMVRDNVTGLIWEVKQDKDDVRNYANPHDADNTYIWYDSNSDTNGGDPGMQGNGVTFFCTGQFINALNNANYGGHHDWRIPTISELFSITNYSNLYPGKTINANYFPNTKSNSYWSATTYADSNDNAWSLNFLNGCCEKTWAKKSSAPCVRAVRGERSGLLDHWIINDDGTVTDRDTGLIWQRASSPETYNWQQALDYCENLDLAGYTDWRLPNIKELQSLVDYSRYDLSIDPIAFPDSKRTFYWSSTNGEPDMWGTSVFAWNVYFIFGSDGKDFKSRGSFVRAVRGGQSGPSNDLDGDRYTENQGDCNDNNVTIHPGAIEICGDGIDQDCNGSDLSCVYAQDDDDGDGFSINQGDCNDNDNTVYPAAIEICGDGIDQDCNGRDLSCLNTDPPDAPTGINASDGTLSGKVQVSWNPSAGATSYDVYRADIPAWAGGVPKRIATSFTGTSYDDTSAVSGRQYYYWVKSKNTSGGSGYSMFNPGYWGTKGYVPSLPVNVAASDGTVSGKVTVTWTAVPNTVVYEIYRADYPAYLGGNIKNIGTSTSTSYNDATVVNGSQYYYWVKARNSWGVSGYSKFDTGYIGTASPLLPAPTGVAATDGSSGKVTLNWNAVPGALIYEVYRAAKPANGGGVPALLGTIKSPGETYNDATVTCGPTYYYWLKSRNSWGSSGYSKFDTGYCAEP